MLCRVWPGKDEEIFLKKVLVYNLLFYCNFKPFGNDYFCQFWFTLFQKLFARLDFVRLIVWLLNLAA